MPTIEVISIGAKEFPNAQDYNSFALLSENKLESHRSLFDNELKNNFNGIIVHLGNKEFQRNKDENNIGFWFADDLVSFNSEIELPLVDIEKEKNNEKQPWGSDQTMLFKFKSKIITDLYNLLKLMLKISPINEILFLTDYQFGSEKPIQKGIITLEEFLEEHKNVGLIWNCMYHIQE